MTAVGNLRVETRANAGRGASRALRNQNKIPGILYGGDKENVLLAVDPRDVLKGLHQAGFYSTIFELNLNGKTEKALVRDVQFHPVTDNPIHIDFWRVSKDSKIHLSIPVVFINENKCPGIKRGGVLNIVLHTLDVTCLADNIPEQITVDLEGLEIGASVHTASINLPKGVAVTHLERDSTLATIVPPTVQTEGAAGSSESSASS
ncbi:MAG: 50S ribosomal protein L25/general stress protein Ctc [Caedibacter sp. 38-128]|nr:50S ribosomal protein L25/general stress protein Ctc [Holosporales bacterium]OJX03495.1 MAG: 50S ribosomal protein L25/general stress protein Ctc [Caedibacter sp. 38-128]